MRVGESSPYIVRVMVENNIVNLSSTRESQLLYYRVGYIIKKTYDLHLTHSNKCLTGYAGEKSPY